MNFLRGSVLNFERIEILHDSIGHPSKKLLSLEFAHSFCILVRATRHITGLEQTSKLKVNVVRICSQLLYSISSVSIYYGTQSNIQVLRYFHLNLFRASVFNFERFDILHVSIEHLSKNLLSWEFAHRFYILVRATRYITKLNQTSE